MKKESASDVIYQYLSINGNKTSAQLKSELEYTSTCVNNALMRLKNTGLIGKKDGAWGVGQKHEPRKSIKIQVMEMIEDGSYTAEEMAEKIGSPAHTVASEISRLRRVMGLNIKRVYVFGE